MALQITRTARGIAGNYWQIWHKNYDKDTGKTSVRLRCYASADERAIGLENFIAMPEFQVIREFAGDLTTAECYTQVKNSVIVDGVETNFFANATDV